MDPKFIFFWFVEKKQFNFVWSCKFKIFSFRISKILNHLFGPKTSGAAATGPVVSNGRQPWAHQGSHLLSTPLLVTLPQ